MGCRLNRIPRICVQRPLILGVNGKGNSYAYGYQVNDYNFYAYETDPATRSGIYVAYDNIDHEFEARYQLTTNSQGQTVSTLFAEDATISWIKRSDNSNNNTNRPNSSASVSLNQRTCEYTVSVVDYIINGNVSVNRKSAANGDIITITVTPNSCYDINSLIITDRSGSTISYTNNGDGTYTFTMPNRDIMVNAIFNSMIEPAAQFFMDVKSNDWFYGAVKYVYENGIMQGTSATTFEPNAKLSRAMYGSNSLQLRG